MYCYSVLLLDIRGYTSLGVNVSQMCKDPLLKLELLCEEKYLSIYNTLFFLKGEVSK